MRLTVTEAEAPEETFKPYSCNELPMLNVAEAVEEGAMTRKGVPVSPQRIEMIALILHVLPPHILRSASRHVFCASAKGINDNNKKMGSATKEKDISQ